MLPLSAAAGAAQRRCETTADGVTERHADEGSKARHGPRGGVEKGKRDRLPGATTQVPEEPDGALAKGAKDADRDDDETHARAECWAKWA